MLCHRRCGARGSVIVHESHVYNRDNVLSYIPYKTTKGKERSSALSAIKRSKPYSTELPQHIQSAQEFESTENAKLGEKEP